MAKVALLIAVSEYEPGLNSLPGTTNDVEAMRQVLHNPEIGGFDEVKVLVNPQQHEMAVAIEILFDGRQKDDLVLLFFSGHGIKDEGGRLYFAARNTRKNLQGRLFETTAVAASSVHRFMTTSRSKHQVVILDCCFSGAFAEGMLARDDGFVDVKNQLGGEGRAVLTSSTSTQFSFEQQGADTSTYTYYIVDGLKTGAADRDEDGWISVDELHEYAKSRVQEVAPAMKPEIYAIREGFKILLAKAPSDNPQLIYRREVEYLTSAGDGRISDAGRDVLDELRHHLGLTSEETAAIEDKVLEPYREYQRKLKLYEQRFIKEIKREYPIKEKTREQLKRFQKVLGFTDENIALIEAPIIANLQTTKTKEKFKKITAKEKFMQFIIFFVVAVVCFGTGIMFKSYFSKITIPLSTSEECQNNVKVPNVKNNQKNELEISYGEQILKTGDTNSCKQAGTQAFASGKHEDAFNNFKSSLKKNPNDPEALIYLNNAKARQEGNWLKIAVSVPIDTDPDLAEEILRGVAQAQDEVNSNNGINGKLLQVAIANDDEKPGTPTKIAKALVGDPQVLGVVGSASSNATLEAGTVYNGEELVAISPTSTSVRISKFSSYVFRTVPSDEQAAEKLANYMVRNLHKKKPAVFFVFGSDYSKSLKDEFVKAVKKQSNVLNILEFDLSKSNFNEKTAVNEAIKGAEVLMLAPNSETLEKAYEVIKANDRRLGILGGDNIFGQKTLDSLGKQAEGMVVAIPWHIGNASNSKFVNNSEKLWKARVNWRTATSYDATKAIIAGLQKSNTRKELQKTLHSADFSVDGATGKIQFLPSGDRTNNSIFLVQVQQKPGTDKYEFVPLQR
ncbi:caspase, EACC1-associated type [Tolypothrix sp. VBCCA 56010]|uniref:caspase, EACC1-associated type n=1 Tax=Tolypothrix sp. VBCCA 56010 TaxID=3137731 RepID=UPI003D7ED484